MSEASPSGNRFGRRDGRAAAARPLAGRHVIVTGASRGIGRAAAATFLGAGADVLLVARDPERLEAARLELDPDGTRSACVAVDLAAPDAPDRVAAAARTRMPRVDLLLQCAAVLGPAHRPLTGVDVEDLARTLRVDALAPLALVQALAPLLAAARPAPLAVFVTSGLGVRARAGFGPYVVAKFALEGLVRTLAAEHDRHGIRCLLVDPGVRRTDMRRAAFPDEDPAALAPAAELADLWLALALDPSPALNGRRIDASRFTAPNGAE